MVFHNDRHSNSETTRQPQKVRTRAFSVNGVRVLPVAPPLGAWDAVRAIRQVVSFSAHSDGRLHEAPRSGPDICRPYEGGCAGTTRMRIHAHVGQPERVDRSPEGRP
jgi:hypothetical protein